MGGRGGPCFRHSRLPANALGLIATGVLFAAPTPAVSLDGLLAPPPTSDYVRDAEGNGAPVGAFDAAQYASYVGAGGDVDLTSTLKQDGFAGGFGAGWTEHSTGRGLVQLVVAFAGGKGANSWLGTARANALASAYFKRSITMFGIGQYYGMHFANPSAPSYTDVVSFVKGNNFFTVGFISNADDLGGAVATQAKKQFDFAPADSIPPSQWPENLRLLSGGIDTLKIALIAAAVILFLGFLASVGLFFYVRREGLTLADGTLSVDGQSQPPDG